MTMSAGKTPNSNEQGDSELIRELIESIMNDVELRLHEIDVQTGSVPLDRLKTLSKLIENKGRMVPAVCSSLDVCTRYDQSKRDRQLEDYKSVTHDIVYLALEAMLNANRLEATFRRGDVA